VEVELRQRPFAGVAFPVEVEGEAHGQRERERAPGAR
jgi:hypothetical protein